MKSSAQKKIIIFIAKTLPVFVNYSIFKSLTIIKFYFLKTMLIVVPIPISLSMESSAL